MTWWQTSLEQKTPHLSLRRWVRQVYDKSCLCLKEPVKQERSSLWKLVGPVWAYGFLLARSIMLAKDYQETRLQWATSTPLRIINLCHLRKSEPPYNKRWSLARTSARSFFCSSLNLPFPPFCLHSSFYLRSSRPTLPTPTPSSWSSSLQSLLSSLLLRILLLLLLISSSSSVFLCSLVCLLSLAV